jgi:Rieske [2Fe-2S] domain
MGDFVRVARADEIPPGTGKTVDTGGTVVAVFNVDGTYHAIQNTCRHRGGPLSEGNCPAPWSPARGTGGSTKSRPAETWRTPRSASNGTGPRRGRRDLREPGGAFRPEALTVAEVTRP